MNIKDRYYAHILDKVPVTKEEEVVFCLMNDLSDRSGFDWGGVDDETQVEWLQEWVDKVHSILSRR
ncbi:MAG: hypothetical protein FJ006_12750 [Chloroflexi bacterium]|nr:hypothetical protein [Chloroflexota bacterium]